MGRPVDVDRGVVLLVEEVWPGVASLQEDLRGGGEMVVVLLEKHQPSLLETGGAQPFELGQVFRPWEGGGGDDDLGAAKFEQEVPDRLPVQQPMNDLIGVAEQAVVAGRFAILGHAGRVELIFAGLRIEVTEPEGLARHRRERPRIA